MLSKNLITETFSSNLDRCEALCSIYEYSRENYPPALDCDDMLRSAVVMAVSALDLLIHDLFRFEVQRRLAAGEPCDKLEIPFNSVGLSRAELASAIDAHIVSMNSYLSFVAPDKIAQALTRFVPNFWNSVAMYTPSDSATIKTELKEIVRWRNRIAHQADIDPTFAGSELFSVEIEDVRGAIGTLRTIGSAVAATL